MPPPTGLKLPLTSAGRPLPVGYNNNNKQQQQLQQQQLYPTRETGQARTRYGQGVIIILVIITTYGQRTSS